MYSFEIYAKHFIYMGVLHRNTLSCVMSEKSLKILPFFSYLGRTINIRKNGIEGTRHSEYMKMNL